MLTYSILGTGDSLNLPKNQKPCIATGPDPDFSEGLSRSLKEPTYLMGPFKERPKTPRKPKDHTNHRSKAQLMPCRILAFMWLFGILIHSTAPALLEEQSPDVVSVKYRPFQTHQESTPRKVNIPKRRHF